MARTLATFDPAEHSPELEIEEANLVIVHNTTDSDVDRIAKSTFAVSSGRHFVESIFYGDEGDATKGAVGVLKDAQSLTQYLGSTSDSIGWRPGAGEVYAGGALVASGLPPQLLGTPVGVLIDMSVPEVSFWANGVEIASQAMTSGDWFFGASVGGDEPYDLRAFSNFGQRAFFQSFVDQPAGFYVDSTPPETVYAAARAAFISSPTDEPANQVYPPLVEKGGGTFFERAVNFWPWGGSPIFKGGSSGTLSLRNDGRFDGYVAADLRNLPVQFRDVDRLALAPTLTEATIAGVALIDRVDANGLDTIAVRLRDIMSLFDSPLQRQLFPPSTPVEAARNRPVPIALGAVRNIAPVLIDETNRVFALHDAAVTNLASVRDKGDELDPTAPDYQLSNDYRNLILETLPVGKLTADLSSSGELTVVPGLDDALGGAGEFNSTTWTDNILFGTNTDETPDNPIYIDLPAGWEVAPSSAVPSGDDASFQPGASAAGWLTPGASWIGTGGAADRYTYLGEDALRIGSLQTAGTPWMLRTTGNVFTNGTTYRFRVRIVYTYGEDDPEQQTFGGFTMATGQGTGQQIFGPISAPGTYTGYFTANADARLYIGTHRFGNNVRPKVAIIPEIIFEELQDFIPATLEGITLTEYVRQILTVRAGQPEEVWSQDDTQAIDEAAPFKFGFFTADDISTLDALEAPLNSFAASVYCDRTGQLRFTRMRAPELADDEEIVLELSALNIKNKSWGPETDTAPGLTTQIGVRRNWAQYTEADFVDDYMEVSAQTRRRFMAESQLVLSSSVNLAGIYNKAKLTTPLPSLLDDPADGQTLIDEVNGFYSVPRSFYRGLVVSMVGYPIEPNQIVRLTFARFGLDAGKKLCVVKVRENWDTRELVLDLWG